MHSRAIVKRTFVVTARAVRAGRAGGKSISFISLLFRYKYLECSYLDIDTITIYRSALVRMPRSSYRVVMSASKRIALFLPCVGSALSTAVHSLSLSLPPPVSCSGNRVCSPQVVFISLGPVASCLSLAAHCHTSPCFLASLQG